MIFLPGNQYSRKQVWSILRSDEPYPNGGPWATGYVVEGKNLIAFCNINAPGRTGHDFPNSFDENTGEIRWYGKPNSHSEQPTFRALFKGEIKLQMFARWDNKNPTFIYLGQPKILSFQNDTVLDDGTRTIFVSMQVETQFPQSLENIEDVSGVEGAKKISVGSKYERNPRLRAECIRIHGCKCSICGFNFEQNYGELGQNFCHVHHIVPLSEVRANHTVSARNDMIPVCPNCHAMLHRTVPAILPSELKAIMQKLT